MNQNELLRLLQAVRAGGMPVEEAAEILGERPFTDLGFAKIDDERELRVGYPEVIYCAGKTAEQVVGIFRHRMAKGGSILATRATPEQYRAVLEVCPQARYNPLGRTITVRRRDQPPTKSYIAIVSAGTSDLPVVEEAAETAELFGNRVERVVDVGVAGIHRLFARLDVIRGARVVVVVAGMEGALASVVGGLIARPVIAVPTSVGYGANFGGLSALLSMLNSCANGVSVVNIDNGFGAAYIASMINQMEP